MSASSRSGSNSTTSASRILPPVLVHPDLHPRVDDGAERLRQHDGEAAVTQLVDGGPAVARRAARVERHERIDAQQQIDAFVERDRRVQRLVERAVDEIFVADPHRRKEAGQRRRGLDRLRNRNVVAPRRPEGHGSAGVEVGRDEKELAAERAEIVGAARALRTGGCRNRSIDRLSNMPVGTACDSVASDSIMPRRNGSRSACSAARTRARARAPRDARTRRTPGAGRPRASTRHRRRR